MVAKFNNIPIVKAALEKATPDIRLAISSQILRDCNIYCREYRGFLKQSAELASDRENCLLEWNMPYAMKVYYFGEPNKNPNPNASLMWCEVARNNHGAEWMQIMRNLVSEVFND